MPLKIINILLVTGISYIWYIYI